MSAPTPAPGDESPREGYYPDPSIPGYVRYWNGSAWVPGTSRPAPEQDAVEETGPVFLDEARADAPGGEGRPEPATAWQADASRQTGFGDHRVSWGGTGPRAPEPADAAPAASVPAPAPEPADAIPAPAAPAPADDAVPGMRKGGAPVPENTVALRVNRTGGADTARPPAENTAGVRPRDTDPRPPSAPWDRQGPVSQPSANRPPAPQPLPAPTPQQPPARQLPVPAPASAPAPAPQPRPAPAPAPAPAPQAAVPAPPVTPRQPAPAPAPAWQQQRPAGSDEPVVPWKPPVEDPFQRLVAARSAGRPAPLGRRFAARLVDTAVLGALTAAAAVPLAGRALDHIDAKIDAAKLSGETVTVWLLDSTTAALGGAVIGVFMVLGVLLEALPTAKWGRTLGKKLCGLDVRDIESHEPPGFGAALRRWLVYGVLGLLVVGVAGVLWCLVDRPWRQCWHDKAAGTFVAGPSPERG